MTFRCGELAFEIDDGGSLPVRVITHLDATDQYLVQLAPRPGHPWEAAQCANPSAGYIVFRSESLAAWPPR